MNEDNRPATEEELERAYKLYKAKYSIKQIAEKLGRSERTVGRWKKRDGWDARKQREHALMQQQAGMDDVAIARDSLREINCLLNTVLSTLKEATCSVDDAVRYRAAIKDYTASLDKIVRLSAFIQHGGADISKSHNITEKYDWSKLVKIGLNQKKIHGEDFDEEKFVKEAINAEFKKK